MVVERTVLKLVSPFRPVGSVRHTVQLIAIRLPLKHITHHQPRTSCRGLGANVLITLLPT